MKTLYISRINSVQPELTELKVKSVLNKHVFFQLRFVFCCLLFLGSFSTFSQNGIIETDYKIYAPGDVVHISGSNFISGQTVNLVVSKLDQPGSEVYLTSVASSDGTFSDLLYTISLDAGNTNFIINDLLSLSGSTANKAAGGGTSFASALGLSQGKNGGVGDTPISPIDWINGNSNGQKSHYLEGNSIPYRVILNNVTNGTGYKLRIEFDIRHGGKNAIDFITAYNRSFENGGIAEIVDPTSGIPAGIFDELPNMFDIPTPNAAQVVNGKPQPQTAFLALKAKAADVQFAAFNATITDIQYVSQGDITAANSKTQIEITYNVTNGSEYVMFAWSGHIADRRDWGPGSSCASINGSPYHTNMLATSNFVGGAEDRALSTDAVQFFPSCDISAPEPGCVGDTLSVTASTDAPSPQFTWSATNGAVIIGSGATVDVAFPGSGSFVVSVIIVDYFDGQVISEPTTCYDTIVINQAPNAQIAVDDHPDCLDSIGTYHVESGDGYTYQWTVSGDAVIDGSSTSSSVNVDVNQLCSPSFQLSVIVNNNGCISYDTLNYEYSDEIAPVIGAAGDDEVVLCTEDYAFDPPSATDNCDEDPDIVQLDDDIQAGNCAAESTITRGWYFIDACGNISDTVYQTISIVDTIAPVIGAAGDDEVVLCTEDYAFDPPSATDNCDEDPDIVQLDDDIQAGNCAAESTITRGWYFVDDCGNISDTVYQSISIVDTIAPVIGAAGDDEVVLCTEDYAFDPPSATDNCDEDPELVQLDDNIQEGDCDAESTITRGWYFVDECGNISDTVYQSISIVDTIAPLLTEPEDFAIECNLTPEFTPPTPSDDCSSFELQAVGPDTTYVNGEMVLTMTWTALDACGNQSESVDQAITIHICPDIFCSLTQGFYGNAKGIACATGERGRPLMIRLLSAPFGSLVVGKPGRSLTINAVDVDCLIADMPAGGPAMPLALGNNVYAFNCVLPAVFTSPNNGRFRNVLLGQVITLGFNLRLDAELGSVQLEGTQMVTYGAGSGVDGLCGTEDDVPNLEDVRIRLIPSAVLNALDAQYAGDRSIANLYLLANRLLGGEIISGVSLSQINQAVSAINEGFDGCRFLGGFSSAKSEENEVIELVTGKELNYKVFPNPFSLSTTIEFITTESMDVKIDLYSIKGDLITTLYDDVAEGNIQHRVILDGSMLQNGMYFCRIYTKNEVYETRIILNK